MDNNDQIFKCVEEKFFRIKNENNNNNEMIITTTSIPQSQMIMQTTQRMVAVNPSLQTVNGDETDLEKQKLINQLIQQQNQIEQQKRMEKELQDRQLNELMEKERRKVQQPIGRITTGNTMSRMSLEEAINSLLEERKVDPKDRDSVIRQLLNELNQQQQQAPRTTTPIQPTFQQQQQLFQGLLKYI